MAIATPTVNPLDIPSPLPSEIIRSWPLRNWGKRWVKICQGGTLQLCAKGILLETAGHDWRGERSGSQTIEDVYGIPSQITYELTHVNDRDGKDAAADFLVARGF